MMNKQDITIYGVLITVAIFVTNMGTDMISGVNADLREHEKLGCHGDTCIKLNNLQKIAEENHCINVKQLQGKTPTEILDECL